MHAPQLPFMYGLPKIHKKEIPLRPIVANYLDPRYKLSKWLLKQLTLIKPKFEFCVMNSYEVKQAVLLLKDASNLKLGSIDVVDMFPSIPLDVAFHEIGNLLSNSNVGTLVKEEMLKCLKLCLDNMYFQFEDNTYQQTKGLAMGHPLSPFLANLVLESLEKKILTNANVQGIKTYRYMDDLLIIYQEEIQFETLIQLWNSVHPNITVTQEKETNEGINFLDLWIYRKNNRFHTEVYRKPTAGSMYIHATSNHTQQQKYNIWLNFVKRGVNLCSTQEGWMKEKAILRDLATKNGYSKDIIEQRENKAYINKSKINISNDKVKRVPLPNIPKVTAKLRRIFRRYNIHIAVNPGRKINSMLTGHKTYFRDPLLNSGVYKITCSCGKCYFGQTKRHIKKRFNEHLGYIRRGENKSGLSTHVLEEDHVISLNNVKWIRGNKDMVDRVIREGYNICWNNNNVNENECGNLNYSWKNVILSLKSNKDNEPT